MLGGNDTTEKPWLKASFEIASSYLEQAELALLELGAISISIEDAKDQPLFEPLPGETPLWESSRISALYSDDDKPEQLQSALSRILKPLNVDVISIEKLKNRRWERVWMDQFKPIGFGEKLWVIPSHCQAPDPNGINISLDPGLAFGTGSHATTMLCLEWLANNMLNQKSLIDYGCGSGILAVAAAKLGAHTIHAVDIDQQALCASRSNASLNDVENKITICAPNELDENPADIVIANILSGILIELSDTLSRLVLPGGKLILSGLLDTQIDEVKSAYAQRFRFTIPQTRDEWVLLEGYKRFA